jgi:hypothetical protein
MATQRAQYEPAAWWLARERIGQDLRERYQVLEELPPQVLAAVRKLKAAESPSGLLEKLDLIEGNQLLRACRQRLHRT